VGLATPAVKPSPSTAEDRPGPRSNAPYLVLAIYALCALYLTLRLWANPAGLAQSGDLDDVNQMSWFIRYSAEAVAHFQLPALKTAAMNAPYGVNLMWNTSLLLPGVIMTPVTLLLGAQVSLNLLLFVAFFGSAASMYFVLRRWGARISTAFLGGALYGFSPAMIGSGIGHYHLVIAIVPPLMIDALLRIVTARGSALRSGIWLGVLTAAQLFIGEEALIDTCIAGAVLLIVLIASRPKNVLADARHKIIGLGSAAFVALVLCARGLWVQFHGVSLAKGGADNEVSHNGVLTHLYTIPYAWVVPSGRFIFHTYALNQIANNYPQPNAEYLAYLGIPLILILLVAGIYFWHVLRIRIAFGTFLLLEILSLGGQPIGPYPGKLLPWYWVQDLPMLKSVLPDRLTILAAGAAGAVLAFALDETLKRWRASGKARADTILHNPLIVCYGLAIVALLPLIPIPYGPAQVPTVPSGYSTTLAQLKVPTDDPVLVVPVPNGGLTDPLRWYADRGQPERIIGGDFIDASAAGRASRAGRAGVTTLTTYLYDLWHGTRPQYMPKPACTSLTEQTPCVPTRSQVVAQMAAWKPGAILANCSLASELGQYLVREFGLPQARNGDFVGWRLNSSGM
jgi:hypothetical protein